MSDRGLASARPDTTADVRDRREGPMNPVATERTSDPPVTRQWELFAVRYGTRTALRSSVSIAAALISAPKRVPSGVER